MNRCSKERNACLRFETATGIGTATGLGTTAAEARPTLWIRSASRVHIADMRL